MDDLAGDVDERDVVGLSDVKDGVAGAVGESSHTDVQTVIAGLNVIDGELCKEVDGVGGREQSKMNLLRCRLRILLPEKSDDLEPELHDGDEAQRGALMVFFYFGSDDVEGGLDQVWEVFRAECSCVGLECLVVFEVVGFVIDHPRRFLVLLCRSWLTERRKRQNLCSRLRWRISLRRLTRSWRRKRQSNRWMNIWWQSDKLRTRS